MQVFRKTSRKLRGKKAALIVKIKIKIILTPWLLVVYFAVISTN